MLINTQKQENKEQGTIKIKCLVVKTTKPGPKNKRQTYRIRTFGGETTVGFKVHLSRLMTKPTKWHVRPAKTQISLGIRPVWSESSLSAWRKLGSLATLFVMLLESFMKIPQYL